MASLMPIDEEIKRIMRFHVGREHAIKKQDLIRELVRRGHEVNERGLRNLVRDMRRNGHLICSAAAEDGGYYIANSRAEVDEFFRMELDAKIQDMSQTRSAMKRTADAQFGEGTQMGLF